MISKYLLAIKLGFIALLTGIAAYYRNLSKRRETEIKDIELGTAKTQIQAQAEAEAADRKAIERGERRSTDAVNRARRGDRSHFE